MYFLVCIYFRSSDLGVHPQWTPSNPFVAILSLQGSHRRARANRNWASCDVACKVVSDFREPPNGFLCIRVIINHAVYSSNHNQCEIGTVFNYTFTTTFKNTFKKWQWLISITQNDKTIKVLFSLTINISMQQKHDRNT